MMVCRVANTECNSRGCEFSLVMIPPIKYSSVCLQVRVEKTIADTEVPSATVTLWGSAADTEMRSNQAGATQHTQLASGPERYHATQHCVTVT